MTDEYKADYARRAGIEGTLSEGIRSLFLVLLGEVDLWRQTSPVQMKQ
ncbi:hypothetical protein [Chamaesiphon sp.]